ncbi:MAG: chorismate lyase [Halioglobus sp.]|nr:chorismate lyase [Halioglobus sp.]
MRPTHPHSEAGKRSARQPLNLQPRRISQEPRWRAQALFAGAALPLDCRHWLLDDGSLTARLTALGKGKFRVQRLSQGWGVPLMSERRLLETPPRQRALVREVALWLGDQPVVYARSVFPVSSLTGSLTHLRRLQNSSLGAILFSDPEMQRSPFELAHMSGDSDYLHPRLRQRAPAWGRRSRFDIGGKALLVGEVFLEAFTPWPASLSLPRSQRGRVSTAILPATQ